jgi:hypothetical protein
VKYLVVEAAVLIEVKCSNKNNYFHRPIKLSDENLAILVKFHPGAKFTARVAGVIRTQIWC